MKAFLVDEDMLTQLGQLYKALHGGTDRERDYGHRLWLICAQITHPNNEVEVNVIETMHNWKKEGSMTTMTHVWVVKSLADDTPTLLSVHTDKESALAAQAVYMADYRHGGTEADYCVHPMELNFTGVDDNG